MAYVNISMDELITLVEKNGNFNRERIKSIKMVNGHQLEITVGVAVFLPDIKILLLYNRFQNGRMYFNIVSSGGAKMLMSLLSEMGNNSGFLIFEKNSIAVDINKMISSNINGIHVKDVSMTREQIYLTLSIK
jgi:hypothetical protein